MGLREYLAVLRRRWLTVLITVGVFIGLAGLISAAREPVYETSIDLFVLARNADDSVDYNANLLAEDRTQTYARLVETRRVAEAVVEDLDLSDDPSDISGRITGQAREDSVIVLVTVRDASPQRAQAIADSVGRVLPPLMREVERADEPDELSIHIEPLGSAPLPTSPATPSSRTLLLIGGMVGLVAGLVLALVRHAFDPRVRCLDDLAHVPAPVIGIVERDAEVGPLEQAAGRGRSAVPPCAAFSRTLGRRHEEHADHYDPQREGRNSEGGAIPGQSIHRRRQAGGGRGRRPSLTDRCELVARRTAERCRRGARRWAAAAHVGGRNLDRCESEQCPALRGVRTVEKG